VYEIEGDDALTMRANLRLIREVHGSRVVVERSISGLACSR
jgi:hypothetical protein